MSFPKLRGFAVYWKPVSTTMDDGGNVSIDTVPVEIRVHWEDVQKEFVDPMGKLVVSTAVVVCNDELQIEGVLKRGKLDSIASLFHTLNDGIFSIKGRSEVPSVDGNRRTMEYYL